MDKNQFETIVKLHTVPRYNKINDEVRFLVEKTLPCDKCALTTTNRRRDYRYTTDNKDRSYWIEKCLDCGKRQEIKRRKLSIAK